MSDLPDRIRSGFTLRLLERVLTPTLLFFGVYFAVLLLWGALLPGSGIAGLQWSACIAAAAATGACWLLIERRGKAVALRVGLREGSLSIADGVLLAAAILGTADLLMRLSGRLSTSGSGSLPVGFIVGIIIPAVLHEELLMRGYLFQKLVRWSPAFAVLLSSAVFALLHAGNQNVSPLAMLNIAIGGLLLCVAFLVRRNLWYPISIHFGWNLISGPLLGHEVSGFVVPSSLILLRDAGPALITGGAFGIEGSVLMTLTESLALGFLLWRVAARVRKTTASAALVLSPAEQSKEKQ